METSLFAKNILWLRKKGKITQAEIPDLLDIKAGTWSNYENGITEPNISTIIRISQFFEVNIDLLLTEEISDANLIVGTGNRNFEANANLNANPSANLKGKEILKKNRNYTISDATPSMLNEDDPTAQWAYMTILKKMDEKLDQLLLSAQNKPG